MKTAAWRRLLGGLVCLALLVLVNTARADWDPGDSYKMHYPQLPDPLGWDVMFSQPLVLADDWMCTETGPVSDVHLWFSSMQDQPFNLSSIHLSIHSDVPAGASFSHPGDLLWQADFTPPQFKTRYYGSGVQGWFDPSVPYSVISDHTEYYQINITGITNPFIQTNGTIYWLDVSVTANHMLGWKTSGSTHFMDDAVWLSLVAGWQPLEDPLTGQSLDLAFVITPEPGALALVGLGGLMMVGLRRILRRRT